MGSCTEAQLYNPSVPKAAQEKQALTFEEARKVVIEAVRSLGKRAKA